MASSSGGAREDPCSFDEFKLYYESTERVTDRRLNTNRWNYSISVAILLAIAGIYSWGIGNREYFMLAGFAILLLALLAAAFSLFWLRQVEDWKALNRAKFTVLSSMAKQLQFESPNGPSETRSYRPFDKEWALLESEKSVTKVRIKLGQIEALNASGAELFMPRVFMVLFLGVFVAILIAVVVSWSSIPHEIAPVIGSSALSSLEYLHVKANG